MSQATLELRGNARKKIEEGRKILDKAKAEENRDMTLDESKKFDDFHDDADKILAKAERMERQDKADAGAEETRETREREIADLSPLSTQEDRGGRPGDMRDTAEYRAAFQYFLQRGAEKMPAELRATLQIDSDIGGGILAASTRFINTVLKAADNAVPFRQKATVLPASYGESLGVPTLDTDISAFSWEAGELTAAETDDIALGGRELTPHALKRKVVKISKRLIETARIDVEAFIAERVAYALATTLETAYMTGNGAKRPLGVFIASAKGISTSRDVSTGNTSALIKPDGLINAQGTLKPQYQTKAEWLFHRDSITQVRKEKDGEGQYLWRAGLTEGEPNTILGKPYTTSEYVPNTFTTGLYLGLYGDFSYYWIADAISMTVQRLLETYALTGQIGLLFDKLASDGMPVLEEAFVRVKLG